MDTPDTPCMFGGIILALRFEAYSTPYVALVAHKIRHHSFSAASPSSHYIDP